MSSPAAALSSSHTQVPLFLPTELRESALGGAAEIVVESGARQRCFLHIHSEEEREAALESSPPLSDAVRAAHERWLAELRWARAVLWDEPRIRCFVRHRHHLVWPAHKHISTVAAVVRQLVLCDEEGGAAVVSRAADVARAAQVLEREATQPGLHLLTESALPGQPLLYQVAQTRRSERDALSFAMPSVLTRLDGEEVEGSALMAEAKQVSYSVSSLLTMQFAATPLRRLVELLEPQTTRTPTPLPVQTARLRWKALVDQHRAAAEYQSLFADVAESCRGWGASEAWVAQAVGAAVEAERSVLLRTGVHMTVVQRPRMVLLLSPRTRRLEGVTAAEQQAVVAALASHSWADCLSEGSVRFVQLPTEHTTAASLEASIRHLFLSPALSALSLQDCCTVSDPVRVHAELQLVTLFAAFNPYVVVHGSRVEGGFEGDAAYVHGLQRERDQVVADRTDEQLRRGYVEASAPRAAPAAASSAGSATSLKRPRSATGTAATSGASSEAGAYLFKRTLVSLLNTAPLSKSEIQQHPSMQEFRGANNNFDAMLNARLKEVAEYKGKKYQLRD